MNVHRLKTDPEPFMAVRQGFKQFEVRRDDRGFEVGDDLLLSETRYSAAEMAEGAPLEYTGNGLKVRVLYILRGPAYGVPDGFCVMSIEPMSISSVQRRRLAKEGRLV